MQALSCLPNACFKKRLLLILICFSVSTIVFYIQHDPTREFSLSPWTLTLSKVATKQRSLPNERKKIVTTSKPIHRSKLPPCPETFNYTMGAIDVDTVAHSWTSLQSKYLPTLYSSSTRSTATTANQSTMGLWAPADCRSKQTLAVVIPFRDRDEHLRVFINHMHAFLQHQQLTYAILIIEQLGDTFFNRAALFNIGIVESRHLANFDCFVFHDVDLLPQDDRIPYRCMDQPVHLSVAVDKFKYRLPYVQLFGGAVAMSKSQVEMVRGFSNCYFGWGGEDDDMYKRLAHHKFKIFRHPTGVSRYKMLKHGREKLNKPNPIRTKLLKDSIGRIAHDGYPETRYTVKYSGLDQGGLFYRFSIDLNPNQTSPLYNQTCR